MTEYDYLRMAMTSRQTLMNFELQHYDAGFATVYWVLGTRAKRPAVIVQSKGPRSIAPSATMLVYEHGVTSQLFRAGTNDEVDGAGAFSELRIEPQDRSLRV